MPADTTEYGDAEVALDGEILRVVVGSQLHGTQLENSGDRDEMAIYIEPPELVLGFLPRREDYVWRSAGEGQRSGPDDTDLISYSLAKYLRLATKGNPTALLPLFAPAEFIIKATPEAYRLQSIRDAFLSQGAVHRFLGYQRSQLERMQGQSKRHVPNRPELIEKYGWDVKYGSHALRLSLQGLEIVRHGTLTLPMKTGERNYVIAVKEGQYSLGEVVTICLDIAGEINRELEKTDLPPEADLDTITKFAVNAQAYNWERRGLDIGIPLQ